MTENGVTEILREGRKRQHLSLEECAKRTHISLRYLEALEAGRWNDLPSESHRIGFLQLYSRFLGVSAEEVLMLYRQGQQQAGLRAAEQTLAAAPAKREKPSTWSGPSLTWPGLVAGAALIFIVAWWSYHALSRHGADVTPANWAARFHPHHAKLIPSKQEIRTQRVKIVARQPSWLRVETQGQVLYEGILHGGFSKEWVGTGPYQIKLGDVQAVTLSVNEQPVDLIAGAHGRVNTVDLPAASAARPAPSTPAPATPVSLVASPATQP